MKKNIKKDVPGLEFINKLQPITYNLNLDAADKIINPHHKKDSVRQMIAKTGYEQNTRKEKEQIIYTGFVAQDVERAAKSLNYNFSGVDVAKNNNDLYGLRYSEFVVPLGKAVQELSKQNDSLKNQNVDLENKFESQQKEIDELKAMITSSHSTNNQQSAIISSASLAQNVPNPFSKSTIINYSLPQNYYSAKIIITDKKGAILKQINLSERGNGSVLVDASTLAAGAYQYSLYVDKKLINTKQMMLTK